MNDHKYILDKGFFVTSRRANQGPGYEVDVFDASGNYVGIFNAKTLDRVFKAAADYVRRYLAASA